jgi:uncharacterized protein YeaO (DUF488 family)
MEWYKLFDGIPKVIHYTCIKPWYRDCDFPLKKEYLKYDYWAKELTPSSDLRKWFHGDIPGHWEEFAAMYRKELETSDKVADFLVRIHPYKTVTLLYASKEPVYNHARILQAFLEDRLKN